mmetsp:Transcript_19123/g.50305  ORF Transcript_19123/g.50305 Transcript_19123/m.50305 type:complete len:321 (+) Transcript_19123:45-1007(+)
MSVKKFLLRYDPPGLGLQVGCNGDLTMHHVDLPAFSQVKSLKEIRDIVDDLLQKQKSLLSQKRHSSALQKLLGRLYHIEVDADAVAKQPRGPSLRQGQQVVVLRQGGGPPQAHAGEVGALTKLGADKAKHEVTISGDAASGHEPTVVKVKGADSVAPVAPPNAALAVGTLAVLRGLRGHAELNGCLVRVVECEEGGRRFAVQSSEEGQTLRVKKENLLAVEAQGLRLPLRDLVVAAAPPCARAPKAEAPAALEGEALLGKDSIRQGEVVKLHGLKTAQQYNGQTGTVLKVDRARNRYEVQLQDGSVKTVRADNVTRGQVE